MKIYLISKIVTALFLMIMATCRKKIIGLEHIEALEKEDKNWIYSLWHNNILICTWLLRWKKPFGLVSQSKDGEAIANVMRSFGWRLIRGSSSKGGLSALKNMIKEVKNGNLVAITPDGPRGPKYKLQNGAIIIAGKTGAPLVPCHVECTKQWVFTKSWDHHKFPKPFSTIYLRFDKPFSVSAGLGKEEIELTAQEFEQKMLANTQQTAKLIEE